MNKRGTKGELFDVVINRGPFYGNRAPRVLIPSEHRTVAVNQTISTEALILNPDNDELAIYWDFGDGTFQSNRRTVEKAWQNEGEFVVRCIVSDMKGGVGSDSF